MTIRRWVCVFLTLFLTTGAGARAPAHDAAPRGPQRIEFPSLDAPAGHLPQVITPKGLLITDVLADSGETADNFQSEGFLGCRLRHSH